MKAIGCYVPFMVTFREGNPFYMFTWRVNFFFNRYETGCFIQIFSFLWFLHDLSFLLCFLPLKMQAYVV